MGEMEGENEIKSLMKVCVSAFVSLGYCYFIVTKIPKGMTRLLSLLPIFYYFTVLPLTLSSVTLRGTTGFLFTWLANFKLLLFSFDEGPLSSTSPNRPKSLQSFISLACLPIKIKQNSPSKSKIKQNPSLQNPKSSLHSSQKLEKSHMGLAIKLLCLVPVYHLYINTTHFIPHQILLLLYLYLSLELLLAMGATLAGAVGLELEPQSDEPYLSTSLQDFWGRRWNLMITDILRPTVYHPIRRISTRILGKKWAQLLAVLVTFVVSGLMHELIFFYMNNVNPTWEMTWYFVLHGFCTAMEIGVKKVLADRWQLPWVISGPLTVGFVMVTSIWLFLPPALRGGSDLGIRESLAALVILKEKLIISIQILLEKFCS